MPISQKPRTLLPSPVSGFELLPRDGFFSVIVQEKTTNLISNPSFELGAITGYTASSVAATVVTEKQYRGNYSAKVVGGSSGYFGYTVNGCSVGSDYCWSLDMFIPLNSQVVITVVEGGSATTRRVVSGSGSWQRYYITHRCANASVDLRIYFSRGNATIYTDGWQYEKKDHPTSYCDGDMSGYIINDTPYSWSGKRHGSPSTRLENTKTGGREYKLIDLGFRMVGYSGLGSPSVENVSSDLFQGGAFYQRTIKKNRNISIVGSIFGNSIAELEDSRKLLGRYLVDQIDGYQQPITLIFNKTNNAGDVFERLIIPCFYTGGLEGSVNNPFQETITLNFTQMNPQIYKESPAGATELFINNCFLTDTGNNTLTLKRDVYGEWTQIFDTTVNVFYDPYTGTYYIYGHTANINGVANTAGICKYDPASGTLTAMGTGVTGTVYAVDVNARGDVVIALSGGGSAGGVANTGGIALWTGGAWTSIYSVGFSGLSASPNDVKFSSDGYRILCTGWYTSFNSVAGNIHQRSALGAWSTIGTYLTGGQGPNILARDSNGEMYVAGQFTTANGKSTGAVAKLVESSGSWTDFVALSGQKLAIVTGITGSNVHRLFFGLDGYLYLSGYKIYGQDAVSLYNVCRWNRSDWLLLPGYNKINTTDATIHKSSRHLAVTGLVFDYSGYPFYSTDEVVELLYPGTTYVNSDISTTVVFSNPSDNLETWAAIFDAADVAGQNHVNNPFNTTNVVTFNIYGPIVLYEINNPTTSSNISFSPLILREGEYVILTLNGSTVSINSNLSYDGRRKIKGKSSEFKLINGDNFIKITQILSSAIPQGRFIYKPGVDANLSLDTNPTIFRMQGVKSGNSDNGRLYISAGTTPYRNLKFYSDAARTVLVAQTNDYSTNRLIYEMNGSGISGKFQSVLSYPLATDAGTVTFGRISMSFSESLKGLSK